MDSERRFAKFVGVDLGGGKGKNTAIAVLEADKAGARVVRVGTRAPDGSPLYDVTLLEMLRGYSDALVAIDAPLTSTVCMRCQLPRCPGLTECVDPVARWFRQTGDALIRSSGTRTARKPATTPYTQRACEIILQRRYGILPRETLGQGMGPLAARGHYLHRALSGVFQLNRNLIEVYPKATVHLLFGEQAARRYKRAVNTWRLRAEILEALQKQLRFEVWREGCLRNDHCFDAVLCAYTAYLWSKEGWVIPEEDRHIFETDGWIWFPPRPTEASRIEPHAENSTVTEDPAEGEARRQGRRSSPER